MRKWCVKVIHLGGKIGEVMTTDAVPYTTRSTAERLVAARKDHRY